ncbi:MAG: hypothetical protein RLZZ598_802 [Pseudomonadota bacterium]|jgi:phospholipid transport system transporter-binding protein
MLLPESLTAREARATLQALKGALERESGERLLIDALPLRRFDSSALAVLLEGRRLAQAWGKRIELSHPPAALLRLARLYGVEPLITD